MKSILKAFAMSLLVIGLLSTAEEVKAQGQQQPKNPTITDMILNDLKHDKLVVDDGKNLSFELSGKKLVVNGQRMPDEVYKRYRKYLGGNPRKTITYKREVS